MANGDGVLDLKGESEEFGELVDGTVTVTLTWRAGTPLTLEVENCLVQRIDKKVGGLGPAGVPAADRVYYLWREWCTRTPELEMRLYDQDEGTYWRVVAVATSAARGRFDVSVAAEAT